VIYIIVKYKYTFIFINIDLLSDLQGTTK
jgi:hypothetical protein